ncbi:EAL domain-containing protein [Rheinheimera salexigens]|nr:EAL domain-containing protein [Rheinheimera salexigens]
MLCILLLSSPLLANIPIENFTMPWLQLVSWILLTFGLIGKFKRDHSGWRILSWVSFIILAGLMLALLVANTGNLGSIQFSDRPSVALNTVIFILFSVIAGLTAPSTLRFSCSLGTCLALLLTIATIALWLSFMHQLEISNQKLMQKTVINFQQETKDALQEQKDLIQRMVERLSATNASYLPNQIELDLNSYLRDFSSLDYIAVLNSSGNVQYSAAQALDIKQGFDAHFNNDYVLLPTVLNNNFNFYYNQQLDEFFIRVTLAQPNTLGLSEVLAAINVKKLMQSVVSIIVPTGYAMTLVYDDKSDFLLSQLDPQRQYFQLGSYTINSLSELNWRLQLYRDYDVEISYVRQVSEVVLIVGWLACFLALLSQQCLKRMQWQQQRLIIAIKKLKSSLKLQKELQTNHLEFKDNSTSLLCIIDNNGIFEEVSKASNWVLGYSEQELEGRNLLDFVHPDDRQHTEHEFAELLNSHDSLNFRSRYIHKDGNVVHLMWSGQYAEATQKIYAVAKDVSNIVKAERYQAAQQRILQLIAVEAPIDEILKQICLMVEEQNSSVKACVMLKVNQHLKIVSAPSLSQAYHSALAVVPIANNMGSCGTSAFQKNLVIVADIASDHKWNQFADIALAENLAACWSMPLLLQDQTVLGTFALYCDNAREPNKEELALLESGCSFATNAIEQSQQKRLLSESEQRFRSFYQFNPDIVYIINKKGYFVDTNQAGSDLLGWSVNELKQMHSSRIIFDEKLIEASKYFTNALTGEAQSFETSVVSRTGKQHELQITIMPSWINGKVAGVIGIAKDITLRLKTEKKLRLFKRVVDASSNGIIIIDITKSDLPISYVNAGFEKLTGYSYADSVGKNGSFLQGKDPDVVVQEQMRTAIETMQEIRVVMKQYRKDESVFWCNLLLSPVPNEVNVITHYIGILTNITELKKYEQELAYNSSHDLLTGLPNRNLLRDRLSQSLTMSTRHQMNVAIIMINIDGFKLINESLGHLIGDEVLRQLSVRIQKQIQPGDTLARMGGDEFVILLPDFNESTQLNTLVSALRTAIAIPFDINGKEFQISASIGVSISEGGVDEPMELVKQAGMAMYQAELLGRNNAQWYNPEMEKILNKQLSLRAMLKQALANQQFELYYQPQVEAGSGRLVGLEALLRWKHPEIGFIGPDEFIPIAEEMGLIVEIGQWVIEQAATYNRSLQERGIIDLIIAVNVSALQFNEENFVEQLEQTLHKVQLEPKWFELELTESLLLDNIEQVVHKLHHLKQLGINISIDDFGTGYSSLSYLKRLPIDNLKIDRSFIREIVTDQKDAAITRGIIAMAHQLGVKVIAEGVETIAQSTLLYKYSCDDLQGYYFSKPLPVAKLEIFLQQYLPTENAEVDAEQQTLLLVDDEENILHSLKRMLRKQPYNVLTCNSAEQAFELLALHNIQVIVSDQRMPKMSGTEFFSRVKDMYPNTIRIVLSGYTDLRSVTDAINHGSIYKFITKPWQDNELMEEITNAFRLYKQNQRNNK